MDLSVFFLSTPTGLGGFFIDRSRIFLIVPLGAKRMTIRNLVFPLSNRQEVFLLIPRNEYQTMLKDYTLNGAHA